MTAPEITTLECQDCGAAIAPGQAVTLQGLTLCAEDAAHRSVEMLSPNGTRRISVGEIERAASALDVAGRLLRVQRLSGFAGLRP